jgi:hypothetical protein
MTLYINSIIIIGLLCLCEISNILVAYIFKALSSNLAF